MIQVLRIPKEKRGNWRKKFKNTQILVSDMHMKVQRKETSVNENKIGTAIAFSYSQNRVFFDIRSLKALIGC